MCKYIIPVAGNLLFFLFIISTAVVISCSVFQGKTQLEQKSTQRYSQYEQRDLVYHRKQQDSLSSYWYFSTDSPLWFHPDSGLRAIGGKMLAKQYNIKRSEKNLRWRKGKSEEANALDSIVKRENNSLSSILILAVVMAILAGLSYLAWRKIRK